MTEDVKTMNPEVEENIPEAAEVPATASSPAAPEMPEQRPTMLDLPTAINTVIARTEATSIMVAVVNVAIDVLQKRNITLTPEELAQIQNTINIETDKTDKLYHEIEKVLAASAQPQAETSPDAQESEAVNEE